MGIATIGALAATPPAVLAATFGARYAQWLLDAAHGRDDRPVVTSREPKSISRETTFERDLDARRDRDELSQLLIGLCERVAGDLERKGYLGRTIGVKLRFADFAIVTRDVTLDRATRDPAAIRDAVRGCLKRVDVRPPPASAWRARRHAGPRRRSRGACAGRQREPAPVLLTHCSTTR